MKCHVANFTTYNSQKMDEFNLKLAQYCSNKIFEVLYLGDFKMDVIKR